MQSRGTLGWEKNASRTSSESTDAREKPDGSVKFFFAKEQTPQILAMLGNDMVHTRIGTPAG
jgi:hypothetical protein